MFVSCPAARFHATSRTMCIYVYLCVCLHVRDMYAICMRQRGHFQAARHFQALHACGSVSTFSPSRTTCMRQRGRFHSFTLKAARRHLGMSAATVCQTARALEFVGVCSSLLEFAFEFVGVCGRPPLRGASILWRERATRDDWADPRATSPSQWAAPGSQDLRGSSPALPSYSCFAAERHCGQNAVERAFRRFPVLEQAQNSRRSERARQGSEREATPILPVTSTVAALVNMDEVKLFCYSAAPSGPHGPRCGQECPTGVNRPSCRKRATGSPTVATSARRRPAEDRRSQTVEASTRKPRARRPFEPAGPPARSPSGSNMGASC